MNICLLCRNYFPSVGGIETSVYQLSKAFAQMGHTVVIVTTSPKPKKSRKEYAKVVYITAGYPVLSLVPSVHLRLLEKRCMCVLKRINAEHPLGLIVGRDSLMTCAAIKTCPQIPVIYIPSMDVKEFVLVRKRTYANVKQLLCGLLEIGALKIEIKKQEYAVYHAFCSIVFCEGMRTQLKKSFSKRKWNVQVCYPGCTIEAANSRKKLLRKQTHFLFVGRIAPEKNLTMLMQALSLLQEEVRLTIVGDGSGLFELKKMATALKPNIQVVFAGFQQEVLPYYMDADFFILPSKYESFGQVMIEAFTCGVPVIGFSKITGTTNTAVEELVTDHVTGLICREFSAEKLALCMKEAICLKREGTDMGPACIRYAKAHCSWINLAQVCLKQLSITKK